MEVILVESTMRRELVYRFRLQETIQKRWYSKGLPQDFYGLKREHCNKPDDLVIPTLIT